MPTLRKQENCIKKRYHRSSTSNLKPEPIVLLLICGVNMLTKKGGVIMEHIKTQLHVHDMNNTCNAFNKNNTCNDITCSTYETIPKREYGLLLRKMESWGITAPKAIVKKYGVFIVKRAVEYTLATPNVRNKAGYMTYMCNQFKSEATMPVEEKKEEKRINTPKEDLTQPQTNSEQRKSDVLPQVNSYKDARNFICDFYDGLYEENDNVIEFVRKIKKQYNFA